MLRTYLDLSGYTLSGKSAVIDLLREFEGVISSDKEFEFGVFRMKDGLFDLEQALVKDWSPVRSDAAIRRYISLSNSLGNKYKKYGLKWLSSPSGYNYDKLIHPDFLQITQRYIDRLITERSIGYWPFHLHDVHAIDCFKLRLKMAFDKEFSDAQVMFKTNGANFYNETKRYIDELFSLRPEGTVVLHNAFEPYRAKDINLFTSGGKTIVIDRDPRTIYFESLRSRYSDYTSIDSFVEQFLFTRVRASESTGDNVMHLSLDSLIFDYESTLNSIYSFIGKDESLHINKKEFFDPEVSKKYALKWRERGGLSSTDVRMIEEKLGSYCHE